MTSLDMAGFSVSLLLLTPARASLLDAPTSAPAWPVVHDLTTPPPATAVDPLAGASKSALSGSGMDPAVASMVKCAAEALIAAEPQLTQWDMVAGDGGGFVYYMYTISTHTHTHTHTHIINKYIYVYIQTAG